MPNESLALHALDHGSRYANSLEVKALIMSG
jgi:hypothetical protein